MARRRFLHEAIVKRANPVEELEDEDESIPTTANSSDAQGETDTCDSWATEFGTECLSTGPITWCLGEPGESFDEFARFGWGVEQVNRTLTWALINFCGYEVIYDLAYELLAEACGEFEKSQKHKMHLAGPSGP